MFLSNGYGIVVLDDGIEVEQVNNKKNISLVDYYYYLFFFYSLAYCSKMCLAACVGLFL